MSAARNPLPPPDASGTDPDETLKQRFSMGPPAPTPGPVPGPFSDTELINQPPRPVRSRTPGKKASRPDPEGMRRTSYYISREAADAMDVAVAQVMAALGGEVPKHVALSALIEAGAAHAPEVAAALAEARTATLAETLKALRHPDDEA